jgi:hypothetical protein
LAPIQFHKKYDNEQQHQQPSHHQYYHHQQEQQKEDERQKQQHQDQQRKIPPRTGRDVAHVNDYSGRVERDGNQPTKPATTTKPTRGTITAPLPPSFLVGGSDNNNNKGFRNLLHSSSSLMINPINNNSNSNVLDGLSLLRPAGINVVYKQEDDDLLEDEYVEVDNDVEVNHDLHSDF